jgi:hypothetical protein
MNESMVAIQEKFTRDNGERLSLVCECDRISCAALIQVWPEAYEQIREDGASFLVLPGHEDLAVEEVVERDDRYLVVRKRPGEPRAVALETDPRG